MTEAAVRSLQILRSPDHFQWYVVALLAGVIYAYATEVEKRNWHAVVAGLTFWINEFLYEILNSLLLYITGYAPMWCTPGETAYLITTGLNIEIAAMFSVAGLVLIKLLPADKKVKVLGLPNRLLIPALLGLFCVFVEVLLNQWGALVWEYWWWKWPNIYLLVIGYCAPFYLLAWFYDRFSLRAKTIVFAIWAALALGGWLLFAVALKWI
ncbi:MAG: hypothetical protein GX444_04615 [Myxococcales bacterium]|nr:hypothetical protein [Myxococcales bacterium]